MPKEMKLKSSPPPRFGLVMIRTEKEAFATRKLAQELLKKVMKAEAVEVSALGVVLKSGVPRHRYGLSIAEIRNDLSRIRVALQYLLHRE